jgi:hypothetical protein
MSRLEVTVGPSSSPYTGSDHSVTAFTGSDHLALQSAVDYAAARGGGTVRILPGTYEMGNSLLLRDGIRVVGTGDATILRKCDSVTTPLTANIDWYEELVIRGNRLIDTRPASAERRRLGIRIAPGVLRPVLEGNLCQGLDQDRLDQRAARRTMETERRPRLRSRPSPLPTGDPQCSD